MGGFFFFFFAGGGILTKGSGTRLPTSRRFCFFRVFGEVN